MKRLFLSLALASLMLLTACQTSPAAPAPVAAQSTVDLLLSIRKAELELARTEQMSWLKFAADSGSEMVKGFVMGKGSASAVPAAGVTTTQTILQAQAQADNTALQREALADKNSWWNRGLQIVDRVTPLYMFKQNLGFQRYQLDQSNAQSRYTLDAVRGAQTDGFTLGSGAALGGVTAGAGATLGGIGAVSEPTPAE